MAQQDSEDGVYMVLLAVAFLSLLVGVGVVWYYSAQFTNSWMPVLPGA